MLEYPLDGVPNPGETLEVAPGVHWLRMPLPFRLDHINLWLLEDREGWTIVDSGIADPRTKELWRRIFGTRLGSRPVGRLIVTHHHPDHIGLAGWLAESWGIPLSTSRVEWLYARMLCLDAGEAALENREAFYRRAGVPAEVTRRLRRMGNGYAKRVEALPRSFRAVGEGTTLRIGRHDWQAMIGTGHSPAQLCLYCPELRLLIGGDQILPRISPNVSLWPSEPEANPLADYLASLSRFRKLPPDVLVLPSHDRPFRGLRPRIDQLVGHHEDRLRQVLESCAGPATAQEVQRALFARELDDHQLQFAIGESLAHIHALIAQGRLLALDGADGIRRYVRAREQSASRLR